MTKRRKKLKKNFKVISLFLIILLSIGMFSIYQNKFNEDLDKDPNVVKTNKINQTIKQDEIYKIKLLATGDGLIHSVIFNSYKQNDGSYDFTDALVNVKDIVKDYDIAYYNQETPMGDASIAYSGYPTFYAPKEFGDAMFATGFNTVSLASNHSFDKGEKGVLNTLNYFKSTDVLYSGMNESLEDRNNFIIKEKNNITYTMLSYTTITNGLNTPANKTYLVNKFDKDQVKKDIESVRDSVDVLIVAMHWGVEYQNMPNDEQKEIAQYLASLGVDIIIGNHPHILQPITKIDNTIVMYSLGNFISNQYGNDDYSKLVGFMATLDITKTITPDGKTTISYDNLGGELIFTKYDGNPITTANHKNHTVIPFSKMHDNTYLNDYERIYTKYGNVLKSMGTDINIAPLGSKN